MRKTALSLGLEQAFGQTQQLTYSEEGFKDLFRKIYDKWKEWFPTTYWTLEGARQGVIKKTDQLRAYGRIGNEYADLIAGGLMNNESELNSLSASFKSKRPITSVARYLGPSQQFISKINNRGRLQRGRFNLELAEKAIEGTDKEMREFLDQAERFGNVRLLERYEGAVELATLSISQARDGMSIPAGLNAAAFVKTVENLPLEDFNTSDYLRNSNPKVQMEITYRDLERKVLDSYYTPLFEVLRFFIDSRAYSRVVSMLWSLEMPDFEDEDRPGQRQRNEDFLRIVLKLFGVDFEGSLKTVTEQINNSYIAMLAVRCQCSDYLTLHRLFLQAQIAYTEELLRRLRDADPQSISQEAFDNSQLGQPLNVPATYQFAVATAPVVASPAFAGTVPVADEYPVIATRPELTTTTATEFHERLKAQLAAANANVSNEAVEALMAIAGRTLLAYGQLSTESANEAEPDSLLDVQSEVEEEVVEVVEELSPDSNADVVYEVFEASLKDAVNTGFGVFGNAVGSVESQSSYPDIQVGDYAETLEDGGATEDALCQPVTSSRRVEGKWLVELEGYEPTYELEDQYYMETTTGVTGKPIHRYKR